MKAGLVFCLIHMQTCYFNFIKEAVYIAAGMCAILHIPCSCRLQGNVDKMLLNFSFYYKNKISTLLKLICKTIVFVDCRSY